MLKLLPDPDELRMAARQYHLKFDKSAASAVDAYAEYKRYKQNVDGRESSLIKTFKEEQCCRLCRINL